MSYALRNVTMDDFSNDKPASPSSGGVEGSENLTGNLEPRVKKLEEDVAVISNNLAILTVRSSNFATHTDVANVRIEMSAMRGELKEDISSLRGELKEDIASLRGELKEDIASLRGELKEDIASLRGELKGEIISLRGEFHETLQKAINKQTVLLLTILPASLAAIAAVTTWFK